MAGSGGCVPGVSSASPWLLCSLCSGTSQPPLPYTRAATAAAPVQELRRGADQARIYSLAFSKDCAWLAVSSDKGTAHVFALNAPGSAPAGVEEAAGSSGSSPGSSDGVAKGKGQNPTSMLSYVKSMVPIPMPK